MERERHLFSLFLLSLGVFVGVLIHLIMMRDSQGMKDLQERAPDCFPHQKYTRFFCVKIRGRMCGYWIVGVFTLIETLMLCWYLASYLCKGSLVWMRFL
jgi:hypothetical protein